MPKSSVLPSGWAVPQEIQDRLGQQAGRQRAMHSDKHLLLILHAPPAPDDSERTGRYFWREPDGAWSSSDLGAGSASLIRHLDDFDSRLDELEEHDRVAVDVEDYFSVLRALAPLRRTIGNMQQALQQARETCSDDRELINARDGAYELVRTAELLHTDVKNSLDFAIARRAEEQAASGHRMAVSAHRLNVLAAFFFPVATLAAIFGVNLKHGFEEQAPPVAFLALVGTGLLFGLVLKMFVTRKA